MGRMQRKLFCAAALVFLSACAKDEIGEARYAPEQCRRLALIDAETGEPVRGAEDFAVDNRRGRLFVSAYDRRAAEKAARRRSTSVPNGGVYALPFEDIFNFDTELIKVSSLAMPDDIAGGLRPHGIAYDAQRRELVFVNRTYQQINGDWLMTPYLQRLGANGEMFVGAANEAPCSANDVLVTEQHTFTTFDHGACDWRAGFEDVFRLKRSGVALDGGRVFDRAAFANGLARVKSGDIILAATRENALVVMAERAGGVEEKTRIETPGGPDNLSISDDGGVVAAAHASLWRLALNRRLGVGKAPSRILKIDPDTGAAEVLFDDPSGKVFSAASVAVETKDGLVVGSATDQGLLVCREAL